MDLNTSAKSVSGPQWDKIGAVGTWVGIFISLVALVPVIAYLWRNAKSLFPDQTPTEHPKPETCPRFKWIDVQKNGLDPRIHVCTPNGFCRHDHAVTHVQEISCWEGTTSFASLFNQAWALARTTGKRVDKPEVLPSGHSFICTDARTVLSFLMCTVPKGKPWEAQSKTLNYGQACVSLITSPVKSSKTGETGIITAHVHGIIPDRQKRLLKSEVQRMLDGYPPWYREVLTTRAGVEFDFPLDSADKAYRGGWIIAVGLRNAKDVRLEPLPVYRCYGEKPNPDWRQNGLLWRRAVYRCYEVLERFILPLPKFQHDINIELAIKSLKYLWEEKTGSGMESIVCRSQLRGPDDLPDRGHLTGGQCFLAMRIFNEFRELSDEEVEGLGKILVPVLTAVVWGAFEVIQYLKDTGKELYIPENLGDFDTEVFLRDCFTDIPLE
ncbi:hypothetical protein BKA65DRAFT_520855 [Rhexocercosporidium sp. MPI-PUGE-AT-0058]|nr:hypothetical protein BKA65DRAFT_520855 [Rhexocercosporidium sp. MPI-PUGE-AT-0058]